MLNGQEVGGRSETSKDGLAGRFQLPLSLLFSSSGGDEACCELFARRKRAMMDGGRETREKRVIDNSLSLGDAGRPVSGWFGLQRVIIM
jgi:hypothetical protein